MLSEEDLARIVKDEIENQIRKGGGIVTYYNYYGYYYILLDGKIYPRDDYDKEVVEGKRSPDDIYAYVNIHTSKDFNSFLSDINYLELSFVTDIVEAYLRKTGFTIGRFYDLPPTPNLKYFIDAIVGYNDDILEYLAINIYDIDSLARSFRIPQAVEQKLGNKPREITSNDVDDIKRIVTEKQPLLAGHTYFDAWHIAWNYSAFHVERLKDEAFKVALAYSQLFPEPYKVCYKLKMKMFHKIDCLKIVIHSFSS